MYPQRISTGVTLIEVLVALLLFSVGTLGIAALQGLALHNNQLALQYTQAALLAENLSERMRSNPVGVAGLHYLHEAGAVSTPTLDCSAALCTPQQLARWDLAAWYGSVARDVRYAHVPAGPSANFANALVAVNCRDNPCTEKSMHILSIYWAAPRSNANGLGCNAEVPADMRCFRLAFQP